MSEVPLYRPPWSVVQGLPTPSWGYPSLVFGAIAPFLSTFGENRPRFLKNLSKLTFEYPPEGPCTDREEIVNVLPRVDDSLSLTHTHTHTHFLSLSPSVSPTFSLSLPCFLFLPHGGASSYARPFVGEFRSQF